MQVEMQGSNYVSENNKKNKRPQCDIQKKTAKLELNLNHTHL
jgi:hypothetical protein